MISTVAVTYHAKKKKRLTYWPVLLFGLILSILFFFFYPIYEAGKVSGVSKIVYYSTLYYIPQTHFKTVESSVTLDELKNKKVYFSENISEEEIPSLKELLGLSEVTKIKPGYDTFASLEKEAILITYPFEKDIRLKSLAIGGVHLFDESADLANYSLKLKVPISKEKFNELANEKGFAKEKMTTVFAGGEMILARAVDRLWLNETNNADFLFDRIKTYIQGSDLAVSLLENSYIGDPTPCKGCTTFTSDEKIIPSFKNVGLDVLSLAGNHAGDAGSKGYGNTRRLLDEAGIRYFGTGDNIDSASKFVVLETDGVKVAFLGAEDIAYFYWAGAENQGLNRYSIRDSNGVLSVDKEKIQKDVAAAKADADIVVVFMSWGIEYQNYATKHQQEIAKKLVSAGADLVVASHPHWVQNIEVMENSEGEIIPVWYSLGNFIFDQTHTDPTREAIIANFTFYDKKLVDMRMVPIKTCGYHQTSNNLAYKVAAGEMSYEEVDKIPESQGCVWWQPTPVPEGDPLYTKILERVWEHTSF